MPLRKKGGIPDQSWAVATPLPLIQPINRVCEFVFVGDGGSILHKKWVGTGSPVTHRARHPTPPYITPPHPTAKRSHHQKKRRRGESDQKRWLCRVIEGTSSWVMWWVSWCSPSSPALSQSEEVRASGPFSVRTQCPHGRMIVPLVVFHPCVPSASDCQHSSESLLPPLGSGCSASFIFCPRLSSVWCWICRLQNSSLYDNMI